MRIDKFLNITNILKRRAIAQDMCDNGLVSINGKMAKSSKEVRVGDKITLTLLERQRHFLVLAIPTCKTLPKKESAGYVQEIPS
ncbi:RNA-binding S4 domain-containing protein [Helicobacter mustelae]|uniref:Putative S4 domain protein n=1 Tax=Helicobacter mustelae (strain ATCC 43772 / CCUG 25715 / CIP 103759 / LMG 18044 / NCTC 12198 / R85-136P) TaxID=679897 RepID=D3UHU3_HELM1|nr:RNA-binding S4 domain-containing protein [Helicobacter mustelae]CBG40066.1 Putative S4 domain protein [Helicobacter mustelae 12198]SQH71580.1 S4 domain-containing protein [Helicobacter mustelae]STP12705.1 S4 domain-containing protein [Helicobacter mustelae]